MNNTNSRKALHGKTWGNLKYDADSDTLWWGKYHIDHEFDTIDGALYWIAHMRATEQKFSEQDAKDLAKALSELLGCPILANAYRTTHATKAEAKKKIVSDSGSACDKCNRRFRCLTNDEWAN